ncbi:MAG TPA: translocation/assembly module TamB domain-containing protein [Vicinamibacterales bacterium]
MHESQQPEEENAPQETPAETAPRKRRVGRIALRLLAVVVAIVAALIVTLFTVDLGPQLRELAEREGSKYLERPMHIGRLSAKVRPGEFLIEDFVIEGRAPSDRPFLKVKTLTVKVPWWTLFNRELVIESVVMTDWEMVVESWQGGRHNFPKLTPKTKREGPPRFVTTMRSVLATRGHFVYEDHGTPWSTIARDLTVQMVKSGPTNDYRGRAWFSNGTVKIMAYEPFRVDMRSRFTMKGSNVHFDWMDLLSDGARSDVTGDVDLGKWPEQLYRIKSKIDFPTQKDIYFHGQRFAVSGTGDFTGTFHLFKGGRELKGSFASALAGVNAWRFPNLRGSVLWLPDRLEITDATSDLYGGRARFDYRMAPLGRPGTPARATWIVDYKEVDLARLTDFLETEGLRLAGRATGTNRLEWPLGKWPAKRGGGEVTVSAPAGTTIASRNPSGGPMQSADSDQELELVGPFNPRLSLGYLPIAGHVTYALDPEWIRLDRSWAATERTYVEFSGQTAFGERSRIPFHVTSLDWQESDRFLAGIMTAFGAPTGAVPVGGHGEFDGVLLDAFKRPRVQGKMRSERMHAWDVTWGDGTADLAIENSYVFVSNGVMSTGGGEIRADGQFSLGYPRRDNGDEIDARIRVSKWPLVDLRHAFNLDDYPVEGTVSGEYQLYGKYQTPLGFGRLNIEKGTAYGETFDLATAALRFEGNGVRLDGIDIKKGTGGVTGAAWVGWDGTYSFNADGRRIPVESLASVAFPRAPLSGLVQFNATGAGTFDEPRYDVKLSVDDLFAGDEGIGQLSGRLALRGDLLTLDLEAASPRLVVSGSGRIALTPEMDAELTVRFRETSLDPYVRFFEPRLSPFTTAVAGGTIRVVGELANLDHLMVDTHVEQLDLKLFDYRVRNEGPIELTLDRNRLQIGSFHLAGDGTALQLDGGLRLDDRSIGIQAAGDANLGILQGFFRNLRSRGTAALKAEIRGSFDRPIFAGSATIADGRLRHFSLPHSLESINGTLSFDPSGVRVDDAQGRLGGGTVVFGGRIGLKGFALGDIALTAVGERMSVRYPEGFRSIIDADLALQGTMNALVLNGNVVVRDSVWSRRIETSPDLFSLASGSAASLTSAAPTIPLRFDLGIAAASSLRIQNNIANMMASADLRLQGTYDHPLLFGRAEIERGDVVVEGNRFVVTPGGSIDFFNPSRIEPFFDLEAETRVRRPGQDYRLTVGLSGTTSRPVIALNSDPPLPEVDMWGLIFGQDVNLNDAELRQLRATAAQASESAFLRNTFTRLLVSPISAPVSRALGEAFGVDTVQITPMLGNESESVTARVVIGKRLSTRAYLTYARALGTSSSARDQVLVLEYDQSDRVGWVLTRLGDGTYALDFRVRHRF